ncbi:hypothetical protein BC828DRAFT_376888 [Blastocladiella britannica]|nr:hypothetical protein BC828DRAFT_376888 [Blastocladiella britannica]
MLFNNSPQETAAAAADMPAPPKKPYNRRFRFPPDAMQPDFFANLRDPGSVLPKWSTSSASAYQGLPAAQVSASVAATGTVARSVMDFNEQSHFALTHSLPDRCGYGGAENDGLATASSQHQSDLLAQQQQQSITQRDYIAHELPDTHDYVNHNNRYPPIYRDEAHVTISSKTLYSDTYRGVNDEALVPANATPSAKARRQRLTYDCIVLGSGDPPPIHTRTSRSTTSLVGKPAPTAANDSGDANHPSDHWLTVTRKEFVALDLASANPERIAAAEMRAREKRPSRVLENPDGETAERCSTVRADFGPKAYEPPDLSFKADLEGTHLSLATGYTVPAASQYMANYVPHHPSRPARISFPRTVLLQEEDPHNPSGSVPAQSTAATSYPAHAVVRHVPVARRDISRVFQGQQPHLTPTDDETTATDARTVATPPPQSVTRRDFAGFAHSATTGTQAIRPSPYSHVLRPEDPGPAADTPVGPESRAAYSKPTGVSAAAFRATRAATRARVAAISTSHFELGTDEDGISGSASLTTAQAHHGATAVAAALLRSTGAATDSTRVGDNNRDDDPIRRRPVIPDHSFATSLRNTVHGDDGDGGVPARSVVGTSVSRDTYVEHSAAAVARADNSPRHRQHGNSNADAAAGVGRGGGRMRGRADGSVAGGGVDHWVLDDRVSDITGATWKAMPGGSSTGGTGGDWLSTTHRVHVRMPAEALLPEGFGQ